MNWNFLLPSLIMFVLAVVLLAIGWKRGEGQHVEGLKQGLSMILFLLPLLVCAFIVAGMVQVLLPKDLITRWVGAESGLRGIFIGSIVGALAPGGPFVCLPIAAGLMRAGVGAGTLVAFLTGWSLWAVNRLPMEIGVMGWKFTLVRFACTLIFPPLAGLIAHVLFKNVSFT